jgi:hypothetical protein
VAGLGVAGRAPAVGDYGHQLGRVQALGDVTQLRLDAAAGVGVLALAGESAHLAARN